MCQEWLHGSSWENQSLFISPPSRPPALLPRDRQTQPVLLPAGVFQNHRVIQLGKDLQNPQTQPLSRQHSLWMDPHPTGVMHTLSPSLPSPWVLLSPLPTHGLAR